MTPWETLGVATDVEVADLRRHYAALIKQYRPETHPQEFARIREAYEVVLPHARRRAALAAERAEAAPVEDVAPVHEEVATPVEVIAPPAEPEPEPEPALALHFRAFHAQAASATGSDDEAHLPALRALLQARTQATLDDSQALEFALMRWFIEAEAPPLTLLFETGRTFDWHRHAERLSNWLSPWALRQMEARLALSRDLVYARHFSGNAWLRRLHAARPGRPLLVWRPAAVEAGFWAERWKRGCEEADAKALAACLNPVAVRRMRGPASTDLLVGLMMGLCAPELGEGVAWWILACVVTFGLRRAMFTLADLPETHRARIFAQWTIRYSIIVGILAITAAAFGALMLMLPNAGPVVITAAWVLLTPLGLFGIGGLWRIAAYAEQVVAWFFQWREAVDRLEFSALLRGDASTMPDRPFGVRLGFVRRMGAIPAALRLQKVEVALRERPPRTEPFKLLGKWRSRGGSVIWRRLWFSAWVLFAIVRLVHAIGGH